MENEDFYDIVLAVRIHVEVEDLSSEKKLNIKKRVGAEEGMFMT